MMMIVMRLVMMMVAIQANEKMQHDEDDNCVRTVYCVARMYNIHPGYTCTGCHNPLQPCSRAARKWRENEEMDEE